MQDLPLKQEYPLLVSIILIIHEFHYLAINTLNSILAQTEKDFEIIIIEAGSSSHDLHIFKEYSKHVTQVHSLSQETISAMMNKGLAFAIGRYVHFMFPGDVYLSKNSFKEMRRFVTDHHYPEVGLTSYVIRDGISLPYVSSRCSSADCLRLGKIPSRLQSAWINRHLLQSVNGFDPRYRYREGYELFCRLIQEKKSVFAWSSRVLTDYEFFKRPPRFILGYLKETMLVIYRHFGLFRAFIWLFFQDHLQIMRWLFRSMKHAFFKE